MFIIEKDIASDNYMLTSKKMQEQKSGIEGYENYFVREHTETAGFCPEYKQSKSG
jgi:hypothetical protein